jgi:hypothetical protein
MDDPEREVRPNPFVKEVQEELGKHFEAANGNGGRDIASEKPRQHHRVD